MLPFRIVKDEDGKNPGEGNSMLNFRKMFKIEEPTAAVLAVVVTKNDEDVRARVEERGFSTDNLQEIDGAFAFLQEEGDLTAEGNATIQFTPELAAVVRLKRFEPFGDSTSFSENLDKNGFLPGFDMALTVLRETVFNALFEAEDPGNASGTIDTAIKEFRSHISDLTSALPESAFKLDPRWASTKEAVEKGVKEFNVTINIGPETSVGAPSIERVDETQTEGGEEVAVNPAVSGSSSSLRKEDGADDEGGEGEKPKAAAEGSEPEGTAKSQDGNADEGKAPDSESDTAQALKQITDTLSALAADVKKTSEAVEGVVGQVGTLNERVDAAEVAAKKADEAVNGTVSADSQGDPDGVRKSNGVDRDPDLIDTGWERLQAS